MTYPFDYRTLSDADKAALLEWAELYARRPLTASGLADLHQVVGRIITAHDTPWQNARREWSITRKWWAERKAKRRAASERGGRTMSACQHGVPMTAFCSDCVGWNPMTATVACDWCGESDCGFCARRLA